MNTPLTKKELRLAIEAQRKAQSGAQVQRDSKRISDHIQMLESFKNSQSIALYMAFKTEVDLEELFLACWQLNKKTYIPYFNAETQVYVMAEITSETEMVKGHYGIAEPKHPKIFPTEEIEFFIVPGVAFDKTGKRLGRGGGYYDRLLANFQGHLTAVAFEFQLVENVPTEPHDQSMHAIVTEKQIISCVQ